MPSERNPILEAIREMARKDAADQREAKHIREAMRKKRGLQEPVVTTVESHTFNRD